MTRIIYDADTLKFISVFESLTGAKVKDCFSYDNLTFIVEKGNMGLAIGKQGSNLRRVEKALKRPIKIIEFDDDTKKFIRNYLYPLNKIEVSQEGNKVIIKGYDTKTRAFIIGREKSNLKKLESIVKRFFSIDSIKVE